MVALGAAGAESGPDPLESLTQLPLAELARVEVSSVSKAPEPLSQAPATVYVITHEEILRSGATSLPEVLRLAPNLQITQTGASAFVAAARGLAGNPADQNFSNKLLMLIDGRSVYTPLYSGIYLGLQDVMLEDVERIEVISGPGAALWGANAVNGVINVITRPAWLTRGGLVEAAAGDRQQDAGLRVGAQLSGDLDLRVYARAARRNAESLADGSSAEDDWYRGQAGLRLDWSGLVDRLTVQGDAYRGVQERPQVSDGSFAGANVLGRWMHRSARSELQLQAYFDQTEQFAEAGNTAFVLHTWDLQLQQNLDAGRLGRIVWGAGERLHSYSITNSPVLRWQPAARDLTLGNVFLQDTVALTQGLKATLGLKLEDDPYAGWQFQPDARLAWNAGPSALLWGAVSRAVRSPTPFDVDLREVVGGATLLTGSATFHPERVTAWQLGYRDQPWRGVVSWSVSAFYNEYDQLRSIEPASATVLFPAHWGNGIRGHTLGVEAWADWQVTPHWRLAPGFRTVHESLAFVPGASGLLGLSQTADDPSGQALLKLSGELPRRLTLDLTARYTAALPDPALPHWFGLDGRLAWRPRANLELAVAGRNLLHARHAELPPPFGELIRRSIYAQLRWSAW